MRLILSICLIVFTSLALHAQTFKLKAGIYDSEGNPLKDIYITSLANTNKHKVSNYKGIFSIKTAIGDTLILVDPNETVYTIPILNQQNKKFELSTNQNKPLADVQLIRKIEDLEKEKYKEIVKGFQTANPQLFYTSVSDMIKAEYPDLIVDEGTGRITIRGLNSLSNQQSALVVVDGVKGMDFRILNPQDIESIKVVKDGTAGIYGGQATGGVVEIKTKRSGK